MYLRMFFWRSESFFALTIFPSGAHRAAICMSLEQAFDPNITTFSERVNLLRMPASSVCLCVEYPANPLAAFSGGGLAGQAPPRPTGRTARADRRELCVPRRIRRQGPTGARATACVRQSVD